MNYIMNWKVFGMEMLFRHWNINNNMIKIAYEIGLLSEPKNKIKSEISKINNQSKFKIFIKRNPTKNLCYLCLMLNLTRWLKKCIIIAYVFLKRLCYE